MFYFFRDRNYDNDFYEQIISCINLGHPQQFNFKSNKKVNNSLLKLNIYSYITFVGKKLF